MDALTSDICGAAPPLEVPELDPEQAARAARLRYVCDDMPGITRRRSGTGFCYRDSEGKLVRDAAVLRRIKALAVPPAWREVWICADPDGHVQAVGRDARGRKQYRYHPRWRAVRDEAKYGRLLLFGRVLPRARARVAADLARRGLPRERVLATVVRLLETTLARIGNDEYARENHSFGLTTLRSRHARITGARVMLDFRGKHGIPHHLEVRDSRLARIVRKCQDLPGQDLFQYLDEAGEARAVASHDVNDYLREISGEDITAKDFRTWAATNLAAVALREIGAADTKAAAKRKMRHAVEAVAGVLGNTAAVCRKCYIHPAVFDGYVDGTLAQALGAAPADPVGMTPDEAAVLAFLRSRLESPDPASG